MFTAVSTFSRSGVIALGVLLGASGGAIAAPLGSLDKPQVPTLGSPFPLHLVVEGEFRDGTNPLWLRRGGDERRWRGGDDEWRRGGGEIQRDGRKWRRDDGEWRRQGEWRRGDGGWRRSEWRRNGHWNGRHWRGGRWYDNDGGVGVTLGIGVPLWGGYDPGYYPGTYDPYYAPPTYYAPRPVYRAPVGSAHVRWCYARYRSYRAWDNTFQPYVGPRQQCYSPFS